MQIDSTNYINQVFVCTSCRWVGYGKELQINYPSEEFAIIEFDCPKCYEIIGSGVVEESDEEKAINVENSIMELPEKIFELGGEGGSITFYSVYSDGIASIGYYYEVSDMGFVEEDIPPSRRKSEWSYTFWESLMRLKIEKPYFYNLYPVFLEQKLSDDLISLLRLCKTKDNAQINYDSWAEALGLCKSELLSYIERRR